MMIPTHLLWSRSALASRSFAGQIEAHLVPRRSNHLVTGVRRPVFQTVGMKPARRHRGQTGWKLQWGPLKPGSKGVVGRRRDDREFIENIPPAGKLFERGRFRM